MAKRGYDVDVPVFGHGSVEDFRAEFEWEEALVEKGIENYRKTGSLVGYVWGTCIADGYAHYMVESERPLVLCHVPAGSGYHIPDAHLRGLRLADIREHADRAVAWKAYMEERAAKKEAANARV